MALDFNKIEEPDDSVFPVKFEDESNLDMYGVWVKKRPENKESDILPIENDTAEDPFENDILEFDDHDVVNLDNSDDVPLEFDELTTSNNFETTEPEASEGIIEDESITFEDDIYGDEFDIFDKSNAAVIDEDARAHLAAVSGGDARRSLTSLEAAAAIAFSENEQAESPDENAEAGGEVNPSEPVRITLAHAQEAVDRAAVRYDKDGDQHYDVISAFIKSIRGSDADAAVHYLARMLEGGEDPRFVARRIMIAASEDIGLADPQALQVATAAAQSVALVGMPEARIILSQAVIYCALAPKSNAAYVAINKAIADVRSGLSGQVPAHLRDAHYAAAANLGHGDGYIYAHDEPGHVAAQQYMPDTLRDKVYYEPTPYGFERTLAERRERIREILNRADS